MRRKKGRSRRIILFVLGMELILIIFILFYIQLKAKVVKEVIVEAGTQIISVDEFIKGSKTQGTFITDLSTLDLNNPNSYEIEVQVGNKIYTSSLKVVDTIEPTATPVDLAVLKDDEVEAQAFVTDIKDITEVEVTYKQAPDFSLIGEQEVTLVLSDTSNNTTELNAQLTIFDMNKSVTIEAGSALTITTQDFIHNDLYSVSFETDLQSIDTNKPGIHEIILKVDGRVATAYIEIIDTAKPVATPVNQELWSGQSLEANDFVKDIIDAGVVKASFKKTPDFTLLGDQAVNIVLEDESGNQAEFSAILTVKEDKEAPIISGVTDKTVIIGDAVSYKNGISATDNKDGEVTFTVNSSNVNLKKEGTYEVIYTATDSSGNIATAKANITVKSLLVSEETIYQMAQDILDDILEDGMTQYEIAYEIYKYTKGHIAYIGTSDKSDWRNEAYRGMTNAVGDCFTYYSVSKALLNQAGIDNIDVQRMGGNTRHYWSFVNVGEGWFHFDSTPHKDHKQTFMLTDQEAEEYTSIRGNNYYTYDKTLYQDIIIE